MTILERRLSRPTTRRDLLRRAGAVGLGAGLAIVGAEVVTAQPAAAGVQSGWRYCIMCQSMVFGTANKYCRATRGAHSGGGSLNYYLSYAPQSVPTPNQSGWAHCKQCYELFFLDGREAAGQCPTGGAHWPFSNLTNYILTMSSTSGGQPLWRYCQRCNTLFYGLSESTSVCSFGGTHDGAGSFNYYISYSTS